ncbi:MAG TPA: hypothetical protein DC017_03135 [Candidatus Wallbacteria bacterium]|nr:hypothetical protein [Candidatus Wallbacteria bacterium]
MITSKKVRETAGFMCINKLEIIEYNLEQIICEVISITNVSAIDRNVRLLYHIDDKIGTLIFADVNKLRYVILNTIQYAIVSAAGDAVVNLDVVVENQTAGAITIKFEIKNSPGKNDINGKPLGSYAPAPSIEDELINSNNLVRTMGGEKIRLAEFKNPIFTYLSFSLNFAKGKLIPTVKPHEINAALSGELNGIVPCKILLVEDNHSNAQVTIDLLTQFYNHSVTWVENGALAVEAISKNSYDVILMDIQMPVMDGFEATRIIRKNGVNTPVIALTAAIMPWAYEECLNSGMDAFISKPTGVKRLGLLIKNAIEKRKAHPEGFQPIVQSDTDRDFDQ